GRNSRDRHADRIRIYSDRYTATAIFLSDFPPSRPDFFGSNAPSVIAVRAVGFVIGLWFYHAIIARRTISWWGYGQQFPNVDQLAIEDACFERSAAWTVNSRHGRGCGPGCGPDVCSEIVFLAARVSRDCGKR